MAHQGRPGTSASPPTNPPRRVRTMQTISANPVRDLWAARNRLTEELLARDLQNESQESTENSESSDEEMGGLTEQEILRHIQQKTYQSCPNETSTHNQTCTICQEDYVEGEKIGRLDCMDIFHLDCIKQWLELRNVCPICKETALEIDEDEDA